MYQHNDTHWCIFFFSSSRPVQRPPNIHFILTQLLSIAWQANCQSQTEFFSYKQIKGSVHYANQTWDILTCTVLQDSQRILSLTPELQLPVHNLPKTHHFPALLHFISAHTKHRLHLLPHFLCVQVRLANLHTTSWLWCPLNNCIPASGKQHFCAPTLHGATLRAMGAQDTSATPLLPQTLVPSHCAHTYLSSPVIASK